MKVGQTLKNIRVHKGLTQQQVARRLKVSRNAYMAWENDQVMLTIGKLNRLCGILDVSIKKFFDPDDAEQPPEEPADDPKALSDFIEEKLKFLKAQNNKIVRLNRKLDRVISEVYSFKFHNLP